MCSRFKWLVSLVIVVIALTCPAQAQIATARVLRVAADPNNLPFSNQRLEGFENKIAALIAQELNAKLEYTWRAQRRGFFRETLKQGDADLVMGIPTDSKMALITEPYYRSSYVFVTRKDRRLAIQSLDNPILRQLKIGVPLAGDVAGNTPPAQALAARGIITNVTGFTVYGDYSEENPPARIMDAVAHGDIDVAIAWGPLAGYFAQKTSPPLELVPIATPIDSSGQPLAFAISIGVKRKEQALRDEVNSILTRRHDDIEKILDAYGVPRLAMEPKEDRADAR
jgi:quinoprotein dehydrogenase-associated probable ABC transporter substrate-binding protein